MSKPLNKLALVTGSSLRIGAAWVKSELNSYSLAPPQCFLAIFEFDNYLNCRAVTILELEGWL